MIQLKRWWYAVAFFLAATGVAAIIQPIRIHWGLKNIVTAPGRDEPARLQSLRDGPCSGWQVSASAMLPADGLVLAAPGSTINVLYFPGGGSRAVDNADTLCAAYAGLPVSIWIANYPGTVAGMREQALGLAKRLGSDPARKPLLVHGLSIGSLLAGDVAAQLPVQGVILDGAITDLQELVAGQARPQVPAVGRPFARVVIDDGLAVFDNRLALARNRAPLLILQGELDTLTPPEFSAQLAGRVAPGIAKRRVLLPGSGHAESLAHPAARAAVQAMVRQVLPH